MSENSCFYSGMYDMQELWFQICSGIVNEAEAVIFEWKNNNVPFWVGEVLVLTSVLLEYTWFGQVNSASNLGYGGMFMMLSRSPDFPFICNITITSWIFQCNFLKIAMFKEIFDWTFVWFEGFLLPICMVIMAKTVVWKVRETSCFKW